MFLATVSLVGCIQGLLVYISVTVWHMHVVTVSVEQHSSAGGQTLCESTRHSIFAALDIFHTHGRMVASPLIARGCLLIQAVAWFWPWFE